MYRAALLCVAAVGCAAQPEPSHNAAPSRATAVTAPHETVAPRPTRAKVEAEVEAVFAEFRLRQEQHQLETGSYLATGSEADLFPVPGGDLRTAQFPLSWNELRILLPHKQLMCSYGSIAGPGGDSTNAGRIAEVFRFDPATTSVKWYYLIARCPASGRLYFATSTALGTASAPLTQF